MVAKMPAGEILKTVPALPEPCVDVCAMQVSVSAENQVGERGSAPPRNGRGVPGSLQRLVRPISSK
jgi:hypothetical protein